MFVFGLNIQLKLDSDRISNSFQNSLKVIVILIFFILYNFDDYLGV